MDHHDVRNLFVLLLWSAVLAGLGGCSRTPLPVTLDARSITERAHLMEQALAQKEPAARFKEWVNDHGERIGARVSVINVFTKAQRTCKEYIADTFLMKNGRQYNEQEHQTVCLDPDTHEWVAKR
jgi:hypothetical protein